MSGVVDQRDGDADALFQAAGQVLERGVPLVLRVEHLDEAVDVLVLVVHLAEVVDVLPHGQPLEGAEALGHHADGPLDLYLVLADLHAQDADGPRRGRLQHSRISTVVVLPAPLGPRKAKTSPFAMLNEISLTAVKLPYFFARFFTSMTFSVIFNHFSSLMLVLR
jgi:hypothetical protein